jgi:hypothetical protein
MAADGIFSVVVVYWFLLYRSRRAAVPPLSRPARGPDLPSLLAES